MSLPDFSRFLQASLPDYTSPPLPDALAATPEAFRGDDVIDAMRQIDAAGNCTATSCHIPFVPSPEEDATGSTVGVVLYGGGLVDPRAYSVLAEPLSERYGFTVVMPVFESDLQFTFGVCPTGRFEFAKEAYPDIEQWLLMGHSFGGVAAVVDAWANIDDPALGGLVLLAADVSPLLCPGTFMDFSATDLPMAQLLATEDLIINMTRVEENVQYLSNNTVVVIIEGGNHGQFGSYNDTLRTPILGQVDGDATIPPIEQWEITIESAYEVALQFMTSLTLSPSGSPIPVSPSTAPTSLSDGSTGNSMSAWSMATSLWIPLIYLWN